MRIIRIICFLASKIFNFFCCRVTSLSASAFRSTSLLLAPRRRALYTFAFACKHFISLKFYKPVNTSFLNRSPSGEARIIPAFSHRATPFCNYFLGRTFNKQTRSFNTQSERFQHRFIQQNSSYPQLNSLQTSDTSSSQAYKGKIFQRKMPRAQNILESSYYQRQILAGRL
jgi:hypothetical protein